MPPPPADGYRDDASHAHPASDGRSIAAIRRTYCGATHSTSSDLRVPVPHALAHPPQAYHQQHSIALRPQQYRSELGWDAPNNGHAHVRGSSYCSSIAPGNPFAPQNTHDASSNSRSSDSFGAGRGGEQAGLARPTPNPQTNIPRPIPRPASASQSASGARAAQPHAASGSGQSAHVNLNGIPSAHAPPALKFALRKSKKRCAVCIYFDCGQMYTCPGSGGRTFCACEHNQIEVPKRRITQAALQYRR
ncbi:hypothetical protein GGX14DRAFT_472815, partial [Mycena pura]